MISQKMCKRVALERFTLLFGDINRIELYTFNYFYLIHYCNLLSRSFSNITLFEWSLLIKIMYIFQGYLAGGFNSALKSLNVMIFKYALVQ